MDKLLFDSHAHINNEGYSDAERAALIERIDAAPLAYVIDVGFDVASSRQAVKNAAARPWCYAAVGVHPHDAAGLTDSGFEELKELLNMPKVVALGETGLDFYRDLSPRDVQRSVFRRQIRLALEKNMPLIIHDRDSAGEAVAILNEEHAFAGAGVLLHCFSGSAEQALEYIGLGCMISIAGPVTYKNNKKTVQVAKQIPLENLLIETDSPYLTPEPFRGKPNDSTNVEYVARKIAELRGLSYEELAAATLDNARRFFGI